MRRLCSHLLSLCFVGLADTQHVISFTKPLAKIAVFALGLLAGLCICFIPLKYHSDEFAKQSASVYGQALADATARQAVQAAFNNDLISLSAIAQATTKHTNVIRSSINSVDNQLLVQALGSHVIEPLHETLTFTAAITLQDNIAGYVNVNIAVKSWATEIFGSAFWGLSTACILAILFCLYRDRNLSFQPPDWLWQAVTSRSNNAHETAPGNKKSPYETVFNELSVKTADENRTLSPCSAYAVLYVKNATVLRRQLNGVAYRGTLNKLDSILGQILRLYGGTHWRWNKNRYIIRFSSSSAAQVTFNAACASRLLLDLAGIVDHVPLDLSAYVSQHAKDLENLPLNYVGLGIECSDESDALLENKVECIDIGGESTLTCKLISGFSEPYAELLERQTQQIRGQ